MFAIITPAIHKLLADFSIFVAEMVIFLDGDSDILHFLLILYHEVEVSFHNALSLTTSTY